MKRLIVLLAAIILPIAAEDPSDPTVGMEGRIEITLAGPLLEARPVTDRAPVIVRVADTAPHGALNRYDLRFTGLRPGSYDLREFLVLPDGSSPTQLPPIPVRISGLLPQNHNGLLVPASVHPLPAMGGYRAGMIVASVAWIAGLLGWSWIHRRHPALEASDVSTTEPTLAERLRPLVESAARGELRPEGQALLERLLLGHWRQRLGWESLSMEEALIRLRSHPEAGSLLRNLEDWLHRPRGTVVVDVGALLAPYRNQQSIPVTMP